MHGICQLCLQHKKLLKQSHIVPKFFEKTIKDGLNRMAIINLYDPSDSKIVQTGVFERYILCEKCDNVIFGSKERYLNMLLFGTEEQCKGKFEVNKFYSSNGFFELQIKGLNYANLKLGLLSILWRAHISQNNFYKGIDIPEYAPLIRRMLNNEEPGEDNQFRIVIVALTKNQKELINIIASPNLFYSELGKMAVIKAGGFILMYELEYNSESELFNKASLKSNGSQVIAVAQPELSEKFILAYFNQLFYSQ